MAKRSKGVDKAVERIMAPVNNLASEFLGLNADAKSRLGAAGQAVVEARAALDQRRYEDAVKHARTALEAGLGRIDASLILLEALVLMPDLARAKTQLDATAAAWFAVDPRETPVEDWDRLVALAQRIGGSTKLRDKLMLAKKNAAKSGDFL